MMTMGRAVWIRFAPEFQANSSSYVIDRLALGPRGRHFRRRAPLTNVNGVPRIGWRD